MSRYIDADKLWNDRPQMTPEKSMNYKAGFSECLWAFSKLIRKQIDNPAADVVEVVRCKDCKYKTVTSDGEYNPEDIVCGYFMSDGFRETDYCSYGERVE